MEPEGKQELTLYDVVSNFEGGVPAMIRKFLAGNANGREQEFVLMKVAASTVQANRLL